MPWTIFFIALTAIVCLASAVIATHAARNVQVVLASLQRRMSSIESKTESLSTSTDCFATEMLALANKLKMKDVRAALSHTKGASTTRDGEPDVKSDPEAWRAWQNRNIKPGVVN